MKNVKDYYNDTAAGWSQEFCEEKNNKEILSKFIDCFAGGGTMRPKILDLGCGAGYDAKVMLDFGAKVVGVDLSEKLIEIANQNLPNAKFFVGDISDKLDKLGKFDGVLCLATIMHIDIEKMKSTFENIADVLYDGGLLLLSAYDGNEKNIKKSIVKVSGEDYDQNFSSYSAEMIAGFAYPKLKLVDMWKFDDFDDGWRYYVFAKVSD